jgi:hypothetical protein
LVLNFPNLAILVGKEMGKIVKIQEKCKQFFYIKIEITNFKEKRVTPNDFFFKF